MSDHICEACGGRRGTGCTACGDGPYPESDDTRAETNRCVTILWDAASPHDAIECTTPEADFCFSCAALLAVRDGWSAADFAVLLADERRRLKARAASSLDRRLIEETCAPRIIPNDAMVRVGVRDVLVRNIAVTRSNIEALAAEIAAVRVALTLSVRHSAAATEKHRARLAEVERERDEHAAKRAEFASEARSLRVQLEEARRSNDYLVPLLTVAARSVGYALAVHGSMARDLDLVAVPWTDEAQNADAPISALLAACGFTTPNPERPAISSGPTAKPHGRTSWTVPLDGGCYIDLSVMPRGGVTPAVPSRDLRDAEDSCVAFEIGTSGHRDCTGDGHYRCSECAHFIAPEEG